MRRSGTAGCRRSPRAVGFIAPTFGVRRLRCPGGWLPCDARANRGPAPRRIRHHVPGAGALGRRILGGIIGLLLAAAYPERIASLVLCNTPTRISDEIRGIYALDQESTASAIRTHGVGGCAAALSATGSIWIMRAGPARMGRRRDGQDAPDIAAALHECFESVDVRPLLSGIKAPVLLLSGDKSRIASEQQNILAQSLPHGRLELFAGYGHGVNLLQPERCARTALDFWRTVESGGR